MPIFTKNELFWTVESTFLGISNFFSAKIANSDKIFLGINSESNQWHFFFRLSQRALHNILKMIVIECKMTLKCELLRCVRQQTIAQPKLELSSLLTPVTSMMTSSKALLRPISWSRSCPVKNPLKNLQHPNRLVQFFAIIWISMSHMCFAVT